MTSFTRVASPFVLLAAGAVVGSLAENLWVPAGAQEVAPESNPATTLDLSEADAEKIKLANDAIATAQTALVQNGSYRPAVRGLNPYAVLAGGVDAVADLEEGRGVDPITFAGLHANLATDEITPGLAVDANGRLTYKGKLVRMYPPERMKIIVARQAEVLSTSAGGRRTGARGAQ